MSACRLASAGRHAGVLIRASRTVSTNLLAFVTAAFFEIAGCFAFWVWLRRGASPLVALLGVVSLVAFALALTRVDSLFAGRAYAAYGGIYIAASLAWLWLAEGQRPNLTDLIGAGIAIAGTLVIIGFAPKAP
jgi:small multidrug resistance family-3 protein